MTERRLTHARRGEPPDRHQILITREFDAPRHLVYRACTTPELVAAGGRTGRRSPRSRSTCAPAARGATRGRQRLRVRVPRRVPRGGAGRADRLHRGLRGRARRRGAQHATFTEEDGRTTPTMLIQHTSKENRDGHINAGMETGTNASLECWSSGALAGLRRPPGDGDVRGRLVAPRIGGHGQPPSCRFPRRVPGDGGARAGALARARRLRRVGPPPPGRAAWGFYEGPPTANGAPGSHHVLAGAFKDIFPRYRTMTGHYVERKGGWDCHGLPVELAVEADLGMESKADIERYGIAEFNARCRTEGAQPRRGLEPADRADRLLGRPRRRLPDARPQLRRVLWWALKTIHDKGLLYEKLKVVPYCPRDQATLSSHELGQPDAYQDVSTRRSTCDCRSPTARPLQLGDELARLDDDALDAGLQRRRRGQPRAHLRRARARRPPQVVRRAGREGPR